jgi:hypothetical protein
VGEGMAFGQLGACYMHLRNYVRAVIYYEYYHAMATQFKMAHE